MNGSRPAARLALVTVGSATAGAFVSDENAVSAVARRAEIPDDLRTLGSTPTKTDVTKNERVAAVTERIECGQSAVDILVDHAGLRGRSERIAVQRAGPSSVLRG